MLDEEFAEGNFCGEVISKGDSVYDGNFSAYYCGKACFNSWAYGNIKEVVSFYRKFLDGL